MIFIFLCKQRLTQKIAHINKKGLEKRIFCEFNKIERFVTKCFSFFYISIIMRLSQMTYQIF